MHFARLSSNFWPRKMFRHCLLPLRTPPLRPDGVNDPGNDQQKSHYHWSSERILCSHCFYIFRWRKFRRRQAKCASGNLALKWSSGGLPKSYLSAKLSGERFSQYQRIFILNWWCHQRLSDFWQFSQNLSNDSVKWKLALLSATVLFCFDT